MSQKLAGKVALVTGASKGIGAEIARDLAANGATVLVNYATSREGAEKVVADITAKGGKAVAVGGSVAQPEQVSALFAQIRQKFDRLDILVNNAGVYDFVPLGEITVEHFRKIYDTNVLGLLLVTQEAVKLFPKDGGSVINISSVAARSAPPATSVYSSTKAAVDAITRALSQELGPKGIRVNSVNPGMVETEGVRSKGIEGSDFQKQVIAQTPLGRVGRPDDIAPMVTFLASSDSKWTTGEVFYIGGGLR